MIIENVDFVIMFILLLFVGILLLIFTLEVILTPGEGMARKRKKRIWWCKILSAKCLHPKEFCFDCPIFHKEMEIWARQMKEELNNGKQERGGISGPDCK